MITGEGGGKGLGGSDLALSPGGDRDPQRTERPPSTLWTRDWRKRATAAAREPLEDAGRSSGRRRLAGNEMFGPVDQWTSAEWSVVMFFLVILAVLCCCGGGCIKDLVMIWCCFEICCD